MLKNEKDSWMQKKTVDSTTIYGNQGCVDDKLVIKQLIIIYVFVPLFAGKGQM